MKNVAVIGAGPAGLMAAEVLAAGGAKVTVYDRMPSVGRKFLMAGRGGLNLTHSEELSEFLTRYGAATANLRAAIEAFPPEALRAWSAALGQSTYVGTSGRVFPVTMKASPLLRAWLRRLDASGVTFALRHEWTGFDEKKRPTFSGPGGAVTSEVNAMVLALGGASWPRLGADGGWVDLLKHEGVGESPLKPSNCGFLTDWSDHIKRHAGQPLKRIALSSGEHNVRGEAIITETGIEGGAIYALSSHIRDAIDAKGDATLHIALRPDVWVKEIERKSAIPRGKQSLSNFLRKMFSLSPVEIALMQEATGGKLATLAPDELAKLINAVPVRLTGTAPIERAISSAGGIRFDQIDAQFMLSARPGVFVAGEMLDWEAPTGGYLLQACFATGVAAGKGALEWLRRVG
jgi:uncharacterized flavoprotein (TIGR03862 family)